MYRRKNHAKDYFRRFHNRTSVPIPSDFIKNIDHALKLHIPTSSSQKKSVKKISDKHIRCVTWPGILIVETFEWYTDHSFRVRIDLLDAWDRDFVHLLTGNSGPCLYFNSLRGLDALVDKALDAHFLFQQIHAIHLALENSIQDFRHTNIATMPGNHQHDEYAAIFQRMHANKNALETISIGFRDAMFDIRDHVQHHTDYAPAHLWVFAAGAEMDRHRDRLTAYSFIYHRVVLTGGAVELKMKIERRESPHQETSNNNNHPSDSRQRQSADDHPKDPHTPENDEDCIAMPMLSGGNVPHSFGTYAPPNHSGCPDMIPWRSDSGEYPVEGPFPAYQAAYGYVYPAVSYYYPAAYTMPWQPPLAFGPEETSDGSVDYYGDPENGGY